MEKHKLNGNCWKDAYHCKECGEGNLCDVCHEHDSPRGECGDCEETECCDI